MQLLHNIATTEMNYTNINPGQIIMNSEYAHEYCLNIYCVNKFAFIDGMISFVKTGINQQLLTNLPITFYKFMRVPMSTYVDSGQAFIDCNSNYMSFAFANVALNTEYRFNFVARIC